MTVPHYGKREAGALTAASPGDTLYFNFGTYNDSGDSEVLSGLAVTDIEVIKNGSATVRATDSGYSLISDTGMVGDRAGLYRFSVQLYNTADDASFYAAGAWYQVFVDAVTIDGKTVRFWCGSFEIGRQRVDVRELAGDTGSAGWLRQAFLNGFADTGLYDTIADYDSGTKDRLGKIGFDVDTGLRVHIDDSDTGVKSVIAALQSIVVFNDTGDKDRLGKIGFDVDTGLRTHINDLDTGLHDILAKTDTGRIATAVWAGDTGLRGILVTTGVNVGLIRGDTGPANNLKKTLDSTPTYFPAVNVTQLVGDTGSAGWLRTTFLQGFTDTGLNERLGRIQSDVDTGLRTHSDDSDTGVKAVIAALQSIVVFNDTGTKQRLGKIESDVDTGLRTHIDDLDTGLANLNVNINQIRGDTGGADRFFRYTQKLDTGGDATVSASVDTGLVNQAVWQANAQRKLTVDTGIADQVWMQLRANYTTDTGTFGEHLGGSLGTAIVDTGVVNQAVWQADAQRKVTVDTGIAFAVWQTATASFNDDTGSFGELLRNPATATVDTGQVNQAVWQANGVRGITAITDTGIYDTLADYDSGTKHRLGVIAFDVDTGLRSTLSTLSAKVAEVDTGLRDTLNDYDTGIRALLALRDTGAIATAVWAGDTGLRDHITNVDTGLTNRLNTIAFDVDTGLRAQISDVDTGLHDILAKQDTGAVATAVWAGDTGLRDHIANVDTGLTNRLGIIAFDVDTGLRTVPAAIKTKTDSLTFTVAGVVDANIQRVNDVNIQGTGDTGTGDTWRPA